LAIHTPQTFSFPACFWQGFLVEGFAPPRAPFMARCLQADATDFSLFSRYEPGHDGGVSLTANCLPVQAEMFMCSTDEQSHRQWQQGLDYHAPHGGHPQAPEMGAGRPRNRFFEPLAE